MPPEVEVAMFHLDYLSCFLTILATALVGRKSWTGLLISIVNSMIVCVIGFRTSQFGFIPANLICICVYAFSIRSWVKKTHTHRIRHRFPGRAASGRFRQMAVSSPPGRAPHTRSCTRTSTTTLWPVNYTSQGDTFKPGIPHVWSSTQVRRIGVQKTSTCHPTASV
jgi:hypothetical protein